MITIVIPTRSRPNDLLKAIESVCAQTRSPDELLIIDQSLSNHFHQISSLILSTSKSIKLNYIHDPNISGLVEAKKIAVLKAVGDIISFIEDDVVLESDYLAEVENFFNKYPNIVGCCGVVTNPPQINFLYILLFKFFHRGIFKDERVVWKAWKSGVEFEMIQSDKLSGGISSWRKDVFNFVHFDVRNGFHMFEDIDFSTRVARHYGGGLYINPNIRLAHYCSPINRDFLGVRQERKLVECFLYYKKRKNWSYATTSFIWVLIGMFLEAVFQSILSYSLNPIVGYFQGIREGLSKKLVRTAYE